MLCRTRIALSVGNTARVSTINPLGKCDTWILRRALKVLVPLSNAEIEAAKEHWEGKHDQSLVDKVNEEMSGHLRKLIMCLVTGDRPEDDDVDEVSITDKLYVPSSPLHLESTFHRRGPMPRFAGARGGTGDAAQ